MHHNRPIHLWKRWLPVFVLLMVLAQLATSAHWHWGEHSSADCGLFSQQNHTDDVISAPRLSSEIIANPVHTGFSLPTFLSSRSTRGQSIRAPPSLF